MNHELIEDRTHVDGCLDIAACMSDRSLTIRREHIERIAADLHWLAFMAMERAAIINEATCDLDIEHDPVDAAFCAARELFGTSQELISHIIATGVGRRRIPTRSTPPANIVLGDVSHTVGLARAIHFAADRLLRDKKATTRLRQLQESDGRFWFDAAEKAIANVLAASGKGGR